jgi:two-component system, NtrC family, response regulator AtoC
VFLNKQNILFKSENMKTKPVLFIVEDDVAFNKLLTSYFTSKDKWTVYSFTNGEESLKMLHHKPVAYLQDFDLPDINGLEVMRRAKAVDPKIEFIFLSGQSDIKVAVNILKEGAFDYIIKDVGAKENALNKLGQIMKIKQLENEKKFSHLAVAVFGVLIIVSWLVIWFFSSSFN